MKPIKLSLTAFGPYKDTEVIDFKQLENHSLYVISGQTGSGKTTIFDGICFALYGTASGEDRENIDMLRSHFADDETHTSVELIFEWKDRTYRILRQLGHVKKGNKTKTGDKYEFYEVVDGGEDPVVDRQIVSEINQKVEALLGLTQDQFKQIVMLPQGEFRKLLTSETENKEAILRRLFKTEDYRKIGERLNEKRLEFSAVVEKENYQLETIIQHVRSLEERKQSQLKDVLSREHFHPKQVIHALRNEASHYELAMKEKKQAYQRAQIAQKEAQERLSAARAINDKIMELANNRERQKQLEEQKVTMTQLEKDLQRAKRATEIKQYKIIAKQTATQLQKVEKSEKEAQEKDLQIQRELQQIKEVYLKEEARGEEREVAKQKVIQLQEYLPKVEQIATMEAELETLSKQAQEMKQKAEQVSESLRKDRKELEVSEEKLRVKEDKQLTYPTKATELQEMRKQVTAIKNYISFKQKQAEKSKALEQEKQQLKQAQDKLYRLETALWDNHANLLAAHLHDGDACPVCGSVEHPNKASNQVGDVKREDVEAAQKLVRSVEAKCSQLQADKRSYGEQMENLASELTEAGVPIEKVETYYDDFVERGKKLSAEVEQLKALANEIKTDREQVAQMRKNIQNLEEEQTKTKEQQQTYESRFETEKVRYEERLVAIPEKMRKLDVLRANISKALQTRDQLEATWQTVQKDLQNHQQKEARSQATKLELEKQLQEMKERQKEAEKNWQDALSKSAFDSEDDFLQAQKEESQIEEWENSLNSYKEEVSYVNKVTTRLTEELQGEEKTDLAEIEQEVERLQKQYEHLFSIYNQHNQTVEKIKQYIKQLTEMELVLRESERKLQVMTDLSDVIRGHNEQRISFERFLQMEYFDQIIQAANLRLQNLSNGQYQLVRSDRQESHRRQSGLSLDVFDAYTGLKRDVKTLSGGEKFNASLCLALGMSDVIQSFQGNVSIDTMFIDEGFGSLDDESLHKAIDTLVELQKLGRTIGVISHVKELKDVFPAILEVNKSKEGYSYTNFVVK